MQITAVELIEFGLIHPETNRSHAAPSVCAGDYDERLASLGGDGTVSVPDGPGLGVEYDWGYIRENTRRRRWIG
jgi:L-alanine-DL-glutamate epimerase-like enolase superfamily enzyme